MSGIKLNQSGQGSLTESGLNNPQDSHMMRCSDVSFHMSTRKNPGGWRTPIGEKTGNGSNSIYGLDQLDALAWQWMDQHENLLEQVCGIPDKAHFDVNVLRT